VADRVDVSGVATKKHWWQRAAAKSGIEWAPRTMPTPSPVVIRAERVSRS